MAQPIWETPAGNLGSFSSTLPFSIEIRATPVYPALLLNYSILNGKLPDNFEITTFNNTCIVAGLPTGLNTNVTYNFTLRVVEERGN